MRFIAILTIIGLYQRNLHPYDSIIYRNSELIDRDISTMKPASQINQKLRWYSEREQLFWWLKWIRFRTTTNRPLSNMSYWLIFDCRSICISVLYKIVISFEPF